MSENPALAPARFEADDGFEIISSADMPEGAARWANDVTVAQQVLVPRDDVRLLAKAGEMGKNMPLDRVQYSIPFGGERVDGPTVQCAMFAQRLFKNCSAECIPIEDRPTHWTFLARFRDLEGGVTVIRAFRQRKSQKTGMEKKDRDRAIDLLFQVGQSKAIRNVIVAAIPDVVDALIEGARTGVLQRIEENLPTAREKLQRGIESLGIELRRVERRVGKIADKWLAPDVVRLIGEVTAIKEGMADADELFPPIEDADKSAAAETTTATATDDAKKADTGSTKKASNAKPAQAKKQDKAADKGDDKPKADPKPEEKTEDPAPETAKQEPAAEDKPKPADTPQTAAETESEDPAPPDASAAPAGDGGDDEGDDLDFGDD